MTVDIIISPRFHRKSDGLISERKGRYLNTEYLSAGSQQRAMLHYQCL
jgi:hypothetical protein